MVLPPWQIFTGLPGPSMHPSWSLYIYIYTYMHAGHRASKMEGARLLKAVVSSVEVTCVPYYQLWSQSQWLAALALFIYLNNKSTQDNASRDSCYHFILH